MKYLLVSASSTISRGPTAVGDKNSDPDLMQHINAIPAFHSESRPPSPLKDYKDYLCEDPPALVLEKLHSAGYKVVAMAGDSGRWVWTLAKSD